MVALVCLGSPPSEVPLTARKRASAIPRADAILPRILKVTSHLQSLPHRVACDMTSKHGLYSALWYVLEASRLLLSHACGTSSQQSCYTANTNTETQAKFDTF
jgi:hypothetical protein